MPSAAGVRDRIAMPDLSACRSLAVQQINHIQGTPPSMQIFSTAVALVAMCDAVELDPHDVVIIANRAMNDLESPFTHQIQAIRDYAKSELRIG